MSKLWALFKAHREGILYLFFGGCTTLVNILVYGGATRLAGLNPLWANALAWVLSVLFAYATNRKWVFESAERSLAGIARELFSFFACRALSGLMDIAIMYLFVDVLHASDMLIKVLSNVLVIIVNYIASKALVFRKK